jgi:hypothetical protein
MVCFEGRMISFFWQVVFTSQSLICLMDYWILIQRVGLGMSAKIKIQEATRAEQQGVSEVATAPCCPPPPLHRCLSLFTFPSFWMLYLYYTLVHDFFYVALGVF